jgi:hypothetical protein
MKHPELEALENGMIGATVPDRFGVVAIGTDAPDRSANLYARLEDWIRVSLDHGHRLPVINGIDLNAGAARVLVTYHGGSPDSLSSEFLGDEAGLHAAFERWEQEASR